MAEVSPFWVIQILRLLCLCRAPRLFQLTRSSLSKTNHSFILKNLASFSSCPVNMYTLSPCTKGAGSGVNTPFTSGFPATAETDDSAANCRAFFFSSALSLVRLSPSSVQLLLNHNKTAPQPFPQPSTNHNPNPTSTRPLLNHYPTSTQPLPNPYPIMQRGRQKQKAGGLQARPPPRQWSPYTTSCVALPTNVDTRTGRPVASASRLSRPKRKNFLYP